MSTSSENRPTFRVVENPPDKVDYEAFKEDFLNPHMLAGDVKKKHGMTKSMWRDYRRRVLDETGLKEKPHKYHRLMNPSTKDYVTAEFIQKKPNGYIIVKKINGKAKYFGRYDDYATAKMVRDKLYANNWDEALGIVLKETYGIGRHNMGYAKAVKVYDEFEDKYFNSDLRIVDILSEMGISNRVYRFLLKMIREKHGEDVHRYKRYVE